MPSERMTKTSPEQELEILDGAISISLKTLLNGNEKEHGKYEPWSASDAQKAITGLLQLLSKRKALFIKTGDTVNLEKEKARVTKLEQAYLYLKDNDSLHKDILDQISYLFS